MAGKVIGEFTPAQVPLLATDSFIVSRDGTTLTRGTLAQVLALVQAAPVAVNAQTGTAYALALADAGAEVTMSNAAANVVTVPPDSSVAFPVGTVVAVTQLGAGQTGVAAGSGVSLQSASSMNCRSQFSKLGVQKLAADAWLVFGDMA